MRWEFGRRSTNVEDRRGSRLSAPVVGGGIGAIMVESIGSIICRTSQLDPDVPVSVHPAPDVLSFRLCSCGCNRDSFRVQLGGF